MTTVDWARALLATAAVGLLLTGCAPTATTSDNPPSDGSISEDGKQHMTDTIPIEIEFLGQQIHGILDDTVIAASLADQLPLTLQFEDYGGQEKIAALPTILDTTEAPRGSDAPAATIGYYAPKQSLVLYYEHVGRFDGIMPLGTLDDITTLSAITTGFTATIRRTS